MSNELSVKNLTGASRTGRPNPAMQRVGGVNLDEGRPWSGDLYDEGVVTDPVEAYASFAGGEDTEAWLDRGDDGTLIGWVRQGQDVYRYADAEAWALDVDGAGMSRSDTPDAAPNDLGQVPTDPEADPAAEPADDGMFSEADVTEGADPAEADLGEFGEAVEEDLPDAPEAFDAETDEATTEVDPTDDLEDPTDLDDEASDEATNPFEGLSDDDAELADDPAAEAAEPEAEPAPDDAATEPAPELEVDPDAATEPDPDADPDAELDPDADPDAAPADEPAEEDEDEELERQKRILSGRVQVKHLPGQHNQESHGDWSKGAGRAIGSIAPKARRSATSSTPGAGDASSAPKAGEAAGKASLSKESLAAMSTEDLDALMEDGNAYDAATREAAAAEYDERDDVHDRVSALGESAAPGSPEEAALFTHSIISPAWAAFAGQGATGIRSERSRKEQIEDEWTDYWLNLKQRASESDDVKGKFMARGVTSEQLAKAHFTEDDMFNGRMGKADVRRFASPELIDWLDQHAITKREWLAEFYPGFEKLLRQLGSGEARGENG